MKINRFVLGGLSESDRSALFARVRGNDDSVADVVRGIVDDVRARGDAALVEHTSRLDGVRLDVADLRVRDEEFAAAARAVPEELATALRHVIGNIREHHRAQLPGETWMHETAPGVIAGERWTPISAVGLYVPRGKGSFPSVMAMLCTPAVIAKVPQIAVCTPPGPDGSVDAASLVAADLCGVRTVYKVGGAQAVAALAYGTETVGRVEKIVGPGNQYVAAAKRMVYGQVDPGTPAGPSESIVLCDASCDIELAARELLVEAEHGPDSAALLVTHSAAVADGVAKVLPLLVGELPEQRREYCTRVFGHFGGIVLTGGLDESIAFVNEYAPEHLRVLTAQPFELLPQITHAGEVLLGEYTSIPFGNFAIGVNAILPTGGGARSQSCVGVVDFLKRSSFAYVSRKGVASVGPVATVLADYEGFPAHAAAARYALDRATRHDSA
jgi:histidinol dehydrogenase